MLNNTDSKNRGAERIHLLRHSDGQQKKDGFPE